MSDLIIGILCTFGLGWVTWVSLTLVKNYNNNQDVGELKKEFHDMKRQITDEIDRINLRQDNFMKQEIESLKGLLDR